MKHVLKIIQVFEFDHENTSFSGAIKGADFDKAKQLAMKTLTLRNSSEAIEDILFYNNESLQTRILAIYVAGQIHSSIMGEL